MLHQHAYCACIPERLPVAPRHEIRRSREGKDGLMILPLPQNIPDSGEYSLHRVPTLSPDSHWQAGQWLRQPAPGHRGSYVEVEWFPGGNGDDQFHLDLGLVEDVEIQTISTFRRQHLRSQAFRERSYH